MVVSFIDRRERLGHGLPFRAVRVLSFVCAMLKMTPCINSFLQAESWEILSVGLHFFVPLHYPLLAVFAFCDSLDVNMSRASRPTDIMSDEASYRDSAASPFGKLQPFESSLAQLIDAADRIRVSRKAREDFFRKGV